MPQDRTLLHEGAALKVERVVSHLPGNNWSPVYTPESTRIVIPASGVTQFRLVDGNAAGESAHDVLLDGITALRLAATQPYQMRPCEGALRSNIVVSHPGSDARTSEAWLLTATALLQLRVHWRDMECGRKPAAAGGQPGAVDAMLHEEPAHGLLGNAGAAAWRPRIAAGATSRRAVQRAQRFMATRVARMDNAWTLNDVADAACSSPFHLARAFRRDLGLSLHAYRTRLRLAAAMQRMEEGERDLSALAHDLGFCNQSHLGDVFRRETGTTPARARCQLAR